MVAVIATGMLVGCAPDSTPVQTNQSKQADLDSAEDSLTKLAQEAAQSRAAAAGHDEDWLTHTEPKYASRVDEVLKDLPPTTKADVAAWALSQGDFGTNVVYSRTFFITVRNFGNNTDPGSVGALNRLRQMVEKNGKFDGHIAESIEAAEQKHSR